MTLAVKSTINNEQIWTEIFHTNASSVDGVVVSATITPVKKNNLKNYDEIMFSNFKIFLTNRISHHWW